MLYIPYTDFLSRGCQLSPVTRYMGSNPTRTSDEICKLIFSSLATNDEIELDNFCPMTNAEVVENLSEDNEKGVDFESPMEEQN